MADQIYISLEGIQELLIGRGTNCVLQLKNKRVSGGHAKLYLLHGEWHICDINSTNGTYVNDKRIKDHVLREGDVIKIGPYELVYGSGSLQVYGELESVVHHLTKVQSSLRRSYPYFTRSPRLLREMPDTVIEIEGAPGIGGSPEINWVSVLLPVAGTLVASLVLSLVSSGTGMLFSVPMMLTGILVTIYNHRVQKKRYEHREELLKTKYQAYINECEEKIKEVVRNQQDTALYDAPAPKRCLDMARNVDCRLWERNPSDGDFLSLRVGLGEEPLHAKMQTPKVGFVLEEDSFTRMPQQLAERYQTVRDMPVLCDLYHVPSLGILGNRNNALAALHTLVIQATTQHGYDDVKLVVLFPQEERVQWDWMRWLPHTYNETKSLRYLADTQYDAAQMLELLTDELKIRAAATSNYELGKKRPKIPHYIFLIGDTSLIQGHPVLDYLLRNDPALGVSCVVLGNEISSLPYGILQIMDLRNQEGQIYRREKADAKRRFQPDCISVEECDAFARALAPIRLPEKESTQLLPSGVTFLEGYHVRKPEELDIGDYWANSCNYKSLSVPIGVRANGENFYFDIHEKKHGPHGLVAGMTGSGKTEMVQAWLLSMAVQFSPQDVAFVLIDFKGTGFIWPFLDLPHLAGTISDLDTNISRNLIALRSELQRRKILFDNAGVGNISAYLKLYRAGQVKEPLPYLFVVIDEYAEFKAKFPDFTAEVNTLFRTGRSMGVHIILLTQNPSGVVSGESEHNVRFRWCLKVASTAASKEMLGGHDDAAYVTHPGRAYVRVGSDEVFEPIQSFYSGADYQPDRTEKTLAEPMVSLVALNGAKTSFKETKKENRLTYGKEINAVVRYISEYAARNHIEKARCIWKDRIPGYITLLDLLKEEEPHRKGELLPVVGLLDDPHTQSQRLLRLPLSSDGHVAVYGAPGTGKTVFLQTVATSICMSYSPEEVHLYVMDFGGWSMGMFRGFPQVVAIANDYDEELIEKVAQKLESELLNRKKLFSQEGVGNLKSYLQITGKQLPYLVLLIDNFAPVFQMYPKLEDFFIKLGREGGNYGICMVVTCSSTMALGYKLSQSVKTSIALQMNDPSEYAAVVGRTDGLFPEKLPGRGLFRGERVMEFQTAVPVGKIEDGAIEETCISEIRRVGDLLTQHWSGKCVDGLAVMPEVVSFGSVKAANGGFVLGLSQDKLEPVEIDLQETHHLLISGIKESGKTTLLRSLCRQMEENPQARIVLYGNASEYICCGERLEILKNAEEADIFIGWLSEELGRRQTVRKADAEAVLAPVYLLIDGYKAFYEGISQQSANRLRALLMAGTGLGVALVAADDADALANIASYMEPVTMLLSKGPVVLLGGKVLDHVAVEMNLDAISKNQLLKAQEGWCRLSDTVCRFKVMDAQ